jgi:hypothetical protein
MEIIIANSAERCRVMVIMKHSILSISLLFLAQTLANAEIRSYNYQMLVDNVTSIYSNPGFTPAPPATTGQILSGVINLDDSVLDGNPSFSVGSYGIPSGGPNLNSISFLDTFWNGTGNQRGLGLVISNDTTTQPFQNALFTESFTGDTLSLYSFSTSSGIGGSLYNQKLELHINDPAAGWLATDALPITFPEFTGTTVGLLRYTLDRGDRVAPSGAVANSSFTVQGHFISISPVPEPSCAVLSLASLTCCLRRKRAE